MCCCICITRLKINTLSQYIPPSDTNDPAKIQYAWKTRIKTNKRPGISLKDYSCSYVKCVTSSRIEIKALIQARYLGSCCETGGQ